MRTNKLRIDFTFDLFVLLRDNTVADDTLLDVVLSRAENHTADLISLFCDNEETRRKLPRDCANRVAICTLVLPECKFK